MGLSKTDVKYWQRTVVRASYISDGQKRRVEDWSVKIQHAGRRETFPLGTPNKTAAAAKARDIYLCLLGKGWDAARAQFKKKRPSSGSVVTIGEFIDSARQKFGGRSKTFEDYARAFRTIVAGIFGVDGGNEKYDYRSGGRDRWLEKIHKIKLSEVTPERVQKWKIAFIRAGHDPIRNRAARISVNSLMRQAKSLFAHDLLRFVLVELGLVKPFDGVKFEPRQSMRYQSGFDIEKLIQQAQEELPVEQFKIFLLASMAGLRRNEIDKLPWPAFRWEAGLIRIEATEHFSPKSEDSIGDVEVDAELLAVFRGYHARATGEFVIESSIAPRAGTGYSHYRCQELFDALVQWLRAHGVDTTTPLHTLRKEFGSQICARDGIYAASTALRHADIAITSQHYLDKKRRVTVGLGGLLNKAPNVISISDEVAQEGKTPRRATDTQKSEVSPRIRRARKRSDR